MRRRAILAGAAAGLGVAALCWAAVSTRARGEASGPPTVADLQGAYDNEARGDSALHDKDLEILGLDCHTIGPSRFVCDVGFVETGGEPGRVYLDAALVERLPGQGWKLLRGLCRRLI
jgi:hypothetical protein